MNITLDQRKYETDRPRRVDISLAKQLERSIRRNGLIRQQLQNLLADLAYAHDETFVQKELNRILLDT